MEISSGLGKADRKRLSAILRETKGTISVGDSAGILKVSRPNAAKMLARWAKKGWLSRVRRGLYVKVPIESSTPNLPLEDPWIVAARIFQPCYIGGWTAAGYWDLTEQIFRTVVVITTQKPRKRKLTIKGTDFMLRTISEKTFFGIKQVWRGQEKVSISDPSRTILDMLLDPKLGGGVRPITDILLNYLKSEERDIGKLIEYAIRLNNGAVFKRLGYLLERYSPDQEVAIRACAARLTKGNAKLDPALGASNLVTRWRIWVPANLLKEA
jgi:predicted transcriptional regulator of viral defense system